MKARQTTTDNNKPIKQDPAPPVKALEGKGGEEPRDKKSNDEENKNEEHKRYQSSLEIEISL